jgi:hypothetical protein
MVEVEVEVLDAPLDYNMLLGRYWTYAMIVFMSSVFCTVFFPHEGNTMMIDQLSFAFSSPNASLGSSIPMIKNSQPTTENIGVRMYYSLMGNFDFSTLSHHVYAMSSRLVSTGRSIPFHTSYFSDPWTLTSLTLSCEGQPHTSIISPTPASNVGDSSPTSASHVGDLILTSASHARSMSPATASYVGGIHMIEKPRCV